MSILANIIEMKKDMKIAIRSIIVVAILTFFITSIAFSQAQPNIEVTKIKENFYSLTSKVPYSANFLAYVCQEGILLVDAGQIQTGNELKPILKTIAIGSAEVKVLINTHAHIDHTGGNLALAGEPLIIGPEILRSTLRDYSYVLYEFPDNALPSITFTDSINVYFGGEMIRIIAVPGSHDATDIIVHFTKAGIVCVGDIFEGMTIPSIDAYTGNLLNYPQVIDKVLSLIPTNVSIVSGHDREANVETLKQSRDMILNTTKIVKEKMSKGKDIAAMQKEDILKDWAEFENGFGGSRNDWIASLADAGPSKYLGSLAEVLYHVLIESDADAAINRYTELKRNHPTEYPFDASMLIRTGSWLIEKGRMKDAIKLMEFCVTEFPFSESGFNKLGEAYIKGRNRELAIKSFEKSLQLNPSNTYAIEKLKELKEFK